MVVLKFGGTSVADREAIRRLVDIVAAARPRPIVVVSALGGATDRLLALAAQAAAGDAAGADKALVELRERHLEVAGVITDPVIHGDVSAALHTEFAELERVVSALGVLRDTSPKWMDAVAAVGELCSSRIVAGALTSRGVPASWVDARTVMVTSDEYTSAAPLMDETRTRVRAAVAPLAERGLVPVIGGFVGATRSGVTTTLGRGGSDYSASIVGASIGASDIQIWTDVDGMLTADPRVVPDARLVPALSFAEASELAYFGAKVLHPATIQPAVQQNIPVRILNSRNPANTGTTITATPPPSGRPVTAVASKRGVTVVDIASTRMLMAHGFLHRLFGVFERHATSVDVVTTSEVSVSVTIDDARRLPAIVTDLRAFADVTHEGQMAVVCAVGEGIASDTGVLSQLLDALGPVPVRMLSQAAGRRNVTLVLRDADLPGALNRVHAACFGDLPGRSV